MASLCWAAVLLGGPLSWTTVLVNLAVISCAALSIRTRQRPRSPAAGVSS